MSQNVDKRAAQIEKTLSDLNKRGFIRSGDTFYSPDCLLPIEDGRPAWAMQVSNFSRVRAYLFVL